jgi:iron complex transport system substrate-binding protein
MNSSPPRIVSLISAGTEMVAALGLEQCLVGVSHECDWPPDVRALPQLTSAKLDSTASSAAIDEQVKALLAAGDSLYDIDIALLTALQPTHIITQAQCEVCAISERDLRAMIAAEPSLAKAQVITLLPNSWSEVERDLLRLATSLGVLPQGEKLVESWHARIDTVRTAMQNLVRRPRVALIEWTAPVMLAGNWLPELLAWAGGDCPLTTAGQHSPYVDWPKIVEFDPEIIIVAPCGYDLRRAHQAMSDLVVLPGWEAVNAVRNKQVWLADGNALFNRSGPRLIETLELLAYVIQPEKFSRPSYEYLEHWKTPEPLERNLDLEHIEAVLLNLFCHTCRNPAVGPYLTHQLEIDGQTVYFGRCSKCGSRVQVTKNEIP